MKKQEIFTGLVSSWGMDGVVPEIRTPRARFFVALNEIYVGDRGG